jgi:hypothetical protein
VSTLVVVLYHHEMMRYTQEMPTYKNEKDINSSLEKFDEILSFLNEFAQ